MTSDWPVVVKKGRVNVGVVMIHDITGLDATNLSFAEKLHAEGFWVAAVDLFRGRVAKDIQQGMAFRGELKKEHLNEALAFGLAQLQKQMPTGSTIGSLGFCMGGGAALQGACTSAFDFCVDWYGMIEDADEVRALKGPLLLILASEDDRINPWAYSALLPKLDEHKKRVRVELYPATIHPFHRPDWIKSPFSGAPSYDAKASDDAWKRVFQFIHEVGGR